MAKHEINKIEEFQSKGYTSNFILEDGQLQETETEKNYSQRDLIIVEEYRYEGMSDPEDMSILYILEGKDGVKGTMLVGYGPSADLELAEFMKGVKSEAD